MVEMYSVVIVELNKWICKFYFLSLQIGTPLTLKKNVIYFKCVIMNPYDSYFNYLSIDSIHILKVEKALLNSWMNSITKCLLKY